MRDNLGHRLCRSGGTAEGIRLEHRLAAGGGADQLHPHDELGSQDVERTLRSQTRTESCFVEVWDRLERWHALTAASTSDIRRQWEVRLAYRWSGRETGSCFT